ncbi:zinc finger protein 821 isoform X2 [Dunckerocampus dactyliophorus]|uniref:zinc finger protein 821 isoform X2 n=1 Tax=Dunckerocampus dactyliophorus TaxID=161453 RepID=UPI002406C396|nr:zinc finger protein 821 isoform X2 [Dunckerocampus dactyliophorus]
MGPFHTTGIAGFQHTINMDGRDEFTEDSECCSNNSQEVLGQESISEDSDSDLDHHGEDSSSNTSTDDHMTTKRTQCHLQGAGVKEENEEGSDHCNNFVCPLCALDFSSPEKLISHVYQHTSMMSSTKSYVCPVCGRALSSPGSLGRHLLIHSEDRLSNCAVCGAHFTDTTSFNREKLKDVLDTTRLEVSGGRNTCPLTHSLSSSPMPSPGPGPLSCHRPGPSPSSCQGPQSCQVPDPSTGLCEAHRMCHGSGHISSSCQGPGPGPGPCSDRGPCAGPDQGPSFPSLPDSLLSEGPSLASIPDALNSSSSGLPPIPDILSPMPVYPAGVLLVCNSCMAYQQLVEAQSPMRKWAVRRKNEPLEARMHRLERERTAKKNKRACETDEERELRRLRDREAKRMQRMQETEEQRARRLQRDRDAMRLKRANETPEKRQARLIREREAKRIKRRLEKIDPALRTQIEHDPAAMAALTADMSLFQFPCPVSVPSMDNGLFMKLP